MSVARSSARRARHVGAALQREVGARGAELDLAQRLALREADQFGEFEHAVGRRAEAGRDDRLADDFRDVFDLSEQVFGGDLLAQCAQEVLLARDAHEVRIAVAVAHVAERVVVTELLIARLQVDFRVVFAAFAVDVQVAVVDVHVHAAERVDDLDEAREVDVDDPVDHEAREDFFLDRFRGEFHRAFDAAQLRAVGVRGVDLFLRVVLAFAAFDVDQQVARNRHHRGLALVGVEAHEQDRVAVRRVGAVQRVLGLGAPVGAEHEVGLRAAGVSARSPAALTGDRVFEDVSPSFSDIV